MHPRPFEFKLGKAVIRVSDDLPNIAIANIAANFAQRGLQARKRRPQPRPYRCGRARAPVRRRHPRRGEN